MALCGVKLKMYSSRHPQTDGNSEIMNRMVENSCAVIVITIEMIGMSFYRELSLLTILQ